MAPIIYYPVICSYEKRAPPAPYLLYNQDAILLAYGIDTPEKLARRYIEEIKPHREQSVKTNFLSMTPPFDMAAMGGIMIKVFPLKDTDAKKFISEVFLALQGK